MDLMILSMNVFVFPVFCVHGGPGDGDVRRLPSAELGVEVGGAAGDDRHLRAAHGSFLHLAVCPLRHRPPQHRVSASECHVQQSRTNVTSWRLHSFFRMSTRIWPFGMCRVWLHCNLGSHSERVER